MIEVKCKKNQEKLVLAFDEESKPYESENYAKIKIEEDNPIIQQVIR